jgi:Tfp pilus assembly protein PilF
MILLGFHKPLPALSPLLPAVLLCLAAAPAAAAPRLPADDREVLERLPLRPADPAAAELRTLRAAARAAPAEPAAVLPLVRRYFALAQSEGDPRYVGYAEAALSPWRGAAAVPAPVLVQRALLRQYRHDFDGALADLALALERDPRDAEARAWRAAIFMVRADYAAAARECAALAPLAGELQATGCSAYVEATTGGTRAAYTRLRAALESAPQADPGERLWVLTRLAEMALRLGEPATAGRHFRAALALGRDDNFLLAAYADFLLEQGRPAEAAALLRDWARSDTLLLRLALAEKALGLPGGARHARELGERFAAAALRGDRLHLAEEARYLLELRGDAAAALAAAAENWKSQREPRDALILLQAARAARAAAAAAPALDWLARSGFEDERLRRLAAELR